MTADLRWAWSRLNANYWFYPALFALAALVLALVMIHLDRIGAAEFLNDVEAIVPARPDSASNMLTIIAGSTISVASTVFSITIAAVAYASGNYGPRLLTNFMEDKGNQLSLATFIGTFVYAVTVLRTVRAEDEAAASVKEAIATSLPGFVPQLSLLVAYGLMALSVAVLVFFLNHIPSSIRINVVLKGIGGRLVADVRERYPDDFKGTVPRPEEGGNEVLATHTGYVQLIDFAGLEEKARRHEQTVVLLVRPGDFVHPGVPLARLPDGPADGGDSDDSDESDGNGIEKCFSFGASRTAEQDPQFLIDELVEIALRALSPGINDPFTAITAIHWLGAATAELGQRDLCHRGIGDGDDEPRRVFPLEDDFDHFLARGFGAMRGAVATNSIAARIMLDTLGAAAAAISDEGRQALIEREGDRLFEQAQGALSGPDVEDVEARHRLFKRTFEQ